MKALEGGEHDGFEKLRKMSVWILEHNTGSSRDETKAVLLDVVMYLKNNIIPLKCFKYEHDTILLKKSRVENRLRELKTKLRTHLGRYYPGQVRDHDHLA